MSNPFRRARPCVVALAAATCTTLLAACSGGGASDTVGGAATSGAADGSGGTLNLYAFSVPKVGFDAVIPGFTGTPEGAGVAFQQSYGPSGDQSRKVAAGAAADVVSFSVEPDMTRLVTAGLVSADWDDAAHHHGVAFGSVVAMVVRKGNPKGIRTWDDLLKPGIEVVTPNPFSSGSAKWNLLAPYAAESDGGTNPAAGLDYVGKLVGDHVKTQPKSGREASDAFLQGQGDVLLSYENEALFLERAGDPVEHIVPEQTFRIDNPVASTTKGANVARAEAFVSYLFTAPAQTTLAQKGFRGTDPAVAQQFASSFPTPTKLYTIDDLGGWKKVDSTLFLKDVGSIATIYDAASK